MEQPGFKSLSAEEVLARQQANPQVVLLDVRMQEEWESHHIPGVVLMPMPTVPMRCTELNPKQEIIVICEHGMRSQAVAHYLVTEAGFEDVASMEGGMSAWPGPVEDDL